MFQEEDEDRKACFKRRMKKTRTVPEQNASLPVSEDGCRRPVVSVVSVLNTGLSADEWVNMQSILSTVRRSVRGPAVDSVDRQKCGWTCTLFYRPSDEVWVDMQSILSII